MEDGEQVGRLGDYGKEPVLHLRKTNEGIFVQVSPVVLFEKESVVFANPLQAGGRSQNMIDVLRRLLESVSTGTKIFLCGEDMFAVQIVKKDGGDFLIKTGLISGSGLDDISHEVFFHIGRTYYCWLLEMFEAVKKDNERFPLFAYKYE